MNHKLPRKIKENTIKQSTKIAILHCYFVENDDDDKKTKSINLNDDKLRNLFTICDEQDFFYCTS